MRHPIYTYETMWSHLDLVEVVLVERLVNFWRASTVVVIIYPDGAIRWPFLMRSEGWYKLYGAYLEHGNKIKHDRKHSTSMTLNRVWIRLG